MNIHRDLLIQKVEDLIFYKKEDREGIVNYLFVNYSDNIRVLIIKAVLCFMSSSRVKVDHELPEIIKKNSIKIIKCY